MAKIDVSKIEGYAEMSAEDKLKALEAFDIPDPDYSGYVDKKLFDKTASELAEKKKELRDKLSEDEAAKLKEKEERDELEEKYNKLLRESAVSKTAEAMADGNLEKVFANQKKHLTSFEKRIRAEALKDTPKPTPDGDSKTMTLKKLREMNPADRLKFSQEHPEEYKELYTGGNE